VVGAEGLAFLDQSSKVPGNKDFCSRSNPDQLNIKITPNIKSEVIFMVGAEGLEPPTLSV
jgi:hypothetical protein